MRQVRLRLDPQSARVCEVWIKALSINGRPLMPDVLSRWVQQGAEGVRTTPDVGVVMSALMPWLSN